MGSTSFLWVFGALLEAKVGTRRLLYIYAVAGIVSSGAQIVLYLAGQTFVRLPYIGEGSLGASAAISGLMGACLVRLHWARVPVLYAVVGPVGMWLGGGLRLPAPIWLGLFTMMDLIAFSRRYEDGIAHFAHLAGYAAGLAAAYSLGLHRDALRERYATFATSPKSDEQLHSTAEMLDHAIALDPARTELVVAKARRRAEFAADESTALYHEAVTQLVRRGELRAAATIFLEGFGVARRPLDVEMQLGITPQLVAVGGRMVAAEALETLLLDMDASCAVRPRALLTFARLLVELGQQEVAHDVYERLAREHGDDPLAARAREWLAKLDEPAS